VLVSSHGVENRTGTKAGGDENGVGLRSASYSANLLNQYTSRDVPGAVDVMGIAFATNTVTVNGQGVYRKGEYFRKELSVNNASAPVWQQLRRWLRPSGQHRNHRQEDGRSDPNRNKALRLAAVA
jgi:hypothetical protein